VARSCRSENDVVCAITAMSPVVSALSSQRCPHLLQGAANKEISADRSPADNPARTVDTDTTARKPDSHCQHQPNKITDRVEKETSPPCRRTDFTSSTKSCAAP